MFESCSATLFNLFEFTVDIQDLSQCREWSSAREECHRTLQVFTSFPRDKAVPVARLEVRFDRWRDSLFPSVSFESPLSVLDDRSLSSLFVILREESLLRRCCSPTHLPLSGSKFNDLCPSLSFPADPSQCQQYYFVSLRCSDRFVPLVYLLVCQRSSTWRLHDQSDDRESSHPDLLLSRAEESRCDHRFSDDVYQSNHRLAMFHRLLGSITRHFVSRFIYSLSR